jgi:tyrosyl-tRNA synthetase
VPLVEQPSVDLPQEVDGMLDPLGVQDVGVAGLHEEDLPPEPAEPLPLPLLAAGGVSLNKHRAEADQTITVADLIAGRYLVVQKGKRNYALVVAE